MENLFDLENVDGNARAGVLNLSHGKVHTPVFMPVGTQATVKAISQEDLVEIGYEIILGNTYHLYLRPGSELIAELGGLHKYMAWPRSILTDSGGYQAFSLSDKVKLTDDGVTFSSHLDGSKHLFSPRRTIEIQREIGADIIMPIDDCAPFPASPERLAASLRRTHDWLARCKDTWLEDPRHQHLFGIVQGGIDADLRRESARACSQLDLPGYSIGGLSVGEPLEHFSPALHAAIEELPRGKPRYVMGVGSIPEILSGVELGVDMFDCVLPTRNARNGQVFTSIGKVNLRNERHARDSRPIDEKCGCRVCQKYSLAYIRHLHKQGEILGLMLSTYHNLYFMFHFMADMRTAIEQKTFAAYKTHWLRIFGSSTTN
jgi:queuine tRNA-ribosyltransferase